MLFRQSSGSCLNERQTERGDDEQNCKDHREAIQIFLDQGRTAHTSTAHATTEHVGHSAALARVKQDEGDQTE